MAAKPIAIIDYETHAIGMRPEAYPPEPVGVAVSYDKTEYYAAWGHPTENNCTRRDAARVLRALHRDYVCVYHNAIFDIEVGSAHLGLPPPTEFEDTLFLAFLHNPREQSLSLKPLAEKYLNMPPTEQDELQAWILRNVPGATKATAGQYIALAPGGLVGRYAVGDIRRTRRLLRKFKAYVRRMGMLPAYDRERRLLPITLRMEQQGIPIAHRRLARDLRSWEQRYAELDKRIRRRLRVGPDVNLRSGDQLADALEARGLVSHWIKTPKGRRSVSADNLKQCINNPQLSTDLATLAILQTYIHTYGRKWLAQAQANNGRMFAAFNQVRSTDEHGGRGKGGTRTGRYSSGGAHGLQLQNAPNDNSAGLPNLRDYIVATPGRLLLGRDYNQQELRILAHYEEGALFEAYRKNPRMDAHDYVQELIAQIVGVMFDRKFIKIQNFGIIYGRGTNSIAVALGETLEVARQLGDAHRSAFPSIRELMRELSDIGRAGDPIVTWGGRVYYAEEPRLVKGRIMEFYYKLLNVLIQGSAADCTKEAMIRVDAACGSDFAMLLQLHDELLGDAEKKHARDVMHEVRVAMESVEFDVPMLSDGKAGPTWTRMKGGKQWEM